MTAAPAIEKKRAAVLARIADAQIEADEALEIAVREGEASREAAAREAKERAQRLITATDALRVALGNSVEAWRLFVASLFVVLDRHSAYRIAGGRLSLNAVESTVGRTITAGLRSVCRKNSFGALQLRLFTSTDSETHWGEVLLPLEPDEGEKNHD